eukprot:scaffold86141_cov62-Attheya_sp.AAC.2
MSDALIDVRNLTQLFGGYVVVVGLKSGVCTRLRRLRTQDNNWDLRDCEKCFNPRTNTDYSRPYKY